MVESSAQTDHAGLTDRFIEEVLMFGGFAQRSVQRSAPGRGEREVRSSAAQEQC